MMRPGRVVRLGGLVLGVLGMLGTLGLSASASADQLAGVELPDTIRVGGQSLVLNGMGLRKRSILKVYVAALYLPERESDPAAILAADTTRRTIMVFRAKMSAGRLCGTWKKGLLDNTPDPPVEVDAQFGRLCRYMEDMDKGDELSFTYVPGRGTTVEVERRIKGRIPGKDFADALLACLIGPVPPSEILKQGLLGGE